MSKNKQAEFRLTNEQIAAIERIAQKGDTAEVKPDGKILHTQRHIEITGRETDRPKS